MRYSLRQSSIISISVSPRSPPFVALSLMKLLVILLAVSFLHNVAFNTGTFYLALYYQVRSTSPLIRILECIFLILDCQFVVFKFPRCGHAPSILSGVIPGIDACCLAPRCHSEAHTQHNRPKMGHLCGVVHRYNRIWCVSCLFINPSLLKSLLFSSALLWLLDTNTRIIMQAFLPLMAGFGVGMLFHAPYQALTNALSPKELAAGTGAFFLVRFTGATVGLACILVTTAHFPRVDNLLCSVYCGCYVPK